MGREGWLGAVYIWRPGGSGAYRRGGRISRSDLQDEPRRDGSFRSTKPHMWAAPFTGASCRRPRSCSRFGTRTTITRPQTRAAPSNLYAVGVTWDATAQTTGIVRVGYQRKEFDAPGQDTYTGLAWEGTIRWSPRTYSFVEFTTAQHTTESTGFGDFTLSRVAFANWTHNWTERIQSAVRAGF